MLGCTQSYVNVHYFHESNNFGNLVGMKTLFFQIAQYYSNQLESDTQYNNN